jgi:hypothetical protein
MAVRRQRVRAPTRAVRSDAEHDADDRAVLPVARPVLQPDPADTAAGPAIHPGAAAATHDEGPSGMTVGTIVFGPLASILGNGGL